VPADRGYVPKHIFGRRYFTKNGSKFYNGGGNYADGSNYYYYYHHHGRKGGGRTPNRYYYHAGQRIYYNNNATNNNNNNNGNYNNNNYRSRAYHQHHHRCSNSGQPTGMTNEQLTDEYIDDCLSTDLAQYQLKLDMDSSLYDEYNTKIIMKRRENIDAWHHQSSQVFNDTYQGDFRHLQRKSKSTLDLLTSDATLNDISNEDGKENTKDTKVSDELTTNDSGNPIQEHTEEKLNAEDDSDMQKHCK
ncbi:unnamed protein product, partial [Trichobilharzia regenti]